MNNSNEIDKSAFQVFFENNFLITFRFKKKKISIIEQIDIPKPYEFKCFSPKIYLLKTQY